MLSISRRPYRLVATTNGSPDLGKAATAAFPPRRERPTLLVVEAEISGQPGHDGLGLGVSLRIMSLLVEDSFLTVSGPLRRNRIAALAESPVSLTAQLGYDYAVETALRIEETRWRIRATITDTKRDAFQPPSGNSKRNRPAWDMRSLGGRHVVHADRRPGSPGRADAGL